MAMSTFCFWPRTRALRITKFIIRTHRVSPNSSSRPAFADAALRSFENVQAACAVDQINQAAVVEAHVIALHPLGVGSNVRHEGGYFTRRVRVRDIDNAQAMREPSHRDFRAANFLAELMHAGIVVRRCSVLFRTLETREGTR